MNDDDDDLWGRFTKDIEPIEKGRSLPEDEKPRRKVPQVQERSFAGAADHIPVSQKRGKELDGRTQVRLESGKLPIDGRIDLHGMTQPQAHRALEFFVLEAYAAGKRCLLVITGKGKTGEAPEHWSDPEVGVLKRRVPEWLNAPPLEDKVLQVVPAARQHGGGGALYVYLRKRA